MAITISGGFTVSGGGWSIEYPIPVPAGDPYFEYDVLLLPGASSTFLDDASTNNFAVNGDAKLNSFNPYIPGYYSTALSSQAYITSPANTAFDFGTGDFTVEFWVYVKAYNTMQYSGYTAVSNFQNSTGWIAGFNCQNGISSANFTTYSGGSVAGSVTASGIDSSKIPLNTWHHVAYVKNGSTFYIFLDGVSYPVSGTYTSIGTGERLCLGVYQQNMDYSGNPNWNISNLRIVKGTAIYTNNFTPSTTPLTAISGTSLLTCQANRFVDSSTNNFALTPNGTASVSSFVPFTPNSSYSTYGSAYFDGGSNLGVPDNAAFEMGSGDYTVEFWFFAQSNSDGGLIFKGYYYTDGSWAQGFGIRRLNATALKFYFNTTGSNTTEKTYEYTTTTLLNTWYHVAMTVSSGVGYAFLNGTLLNPGGLANVGAITNSSFGLTIGAFPFESGYRYFNGYITDVRIVKGTAVYTSTFTPPASPLTAISGTSLLTLQNNQSVNNSVFLDNSTNNFFVTRNGNATQGTFSPYGGNWSNYFDGTGDYLSVSDNIVFQMGTGDFTLEAWVNPNTLPGSDARIWSYQGAGGTVLNLYLLASGSGSQFAAAIRSHGSTGYTQTNGTTVAKVGTWYHVAFSRASGTTKLFVNGVQEGTTQTSQTQSIQNATPSIGGYSTGNTEYFPGYISNLRIVKGTAVYTTAFTPSTTPLTPITNTSLLTCADNRLVDDSINNFTITKNGDVSVQRFSPFNPSSLTPTSYSGYFDGTGDYITAPNTGSIFTFGTGDFTVEAWINMTTMPGGSGYPSSYWILGGGPVTSVTGFDIAIGSTNIQVGLSDFESLNINYAHGMTTNTWYHVAVVRNSNTLSVYKNGTLLTSTSVTGVTADPMLTGVAISAAEPSGATSGNFNGYISNLRVVKGTAVYTSAFTPSTTPLTSISGTSLLTCQSTTFIDNSTNNLTITAFGNSQPTQQNPFGFTSATTEGYSVSTIGGSGYFDGTGDYLTVPSTTAFAMGTGNFTIDGWVYMTVYSAGSCLFGTTNGSTTGYYINLGADLNTFRVVSNASGTWADIITASNGNGIPLNQWVHVAFVRNGANITLYKNGVNVATASGASAYNFTSPSNAGYVGFVTNGISTQYFTGYISDIRAVKGTALYTSNFVPPSAPLTAVQNTTLLNNMTSAGIYDASMMNNLESVGDAKLSTAVTKFGGSSMYFDGTTDYIVEPTNTNFGYSTSDFTIEFWLYLNTVSADQTIFSNLSSVSSVNPHIYYSNGTGIRYYTNSADRIFGGTLSPSTWYHIALCRSSGSTKMFINGTQAGSTYTDSNNYGTTAPLGIGTYWSSGSPATSSTLNGYLDDVRVTKGYARYATDFTPPTEAFPTY